MTILKPIMRVSTQTPGGALALLLTFAATSTHAALLTQPLDLRPSSVLLPTVVAGDPNGSPADSPANRVDPNTTSSPYAGVGSIFVDTPGAGGYLGSGSAISTRHILTAAHLFDTNGDGAIDVAPGDVTFRLNYGSSLSHILTASSVSVHPQYTGFNNPYLNDDIAIITLNTPLPAGVPIYSLSSDPFQFIRTITMVGYGQSGTGVDGYTVDASFSTKRVGYNRAEVYGLDDEGSGAKEVFQWDFDGPTAASNLYGNSSNPIFLTLGNALEAAIGPGDSGGPSFIDLGNGLELFGVNTFAGRSFGQTPGTFGTYGGGMLVSSYRGWIDQTMANVPDHASTALLLLLAFPFLLRRQTAPSSPHSPA